MIGFHSASPTPQNASTLALFTLCGALAACSAGDASVPSGASDSSGGAGGAPPGAGGAPAGTGAMPGTGGLPAGTGAAPAGAGGVAGGSGGVPGGSGGVPAGGTGGTPPQDGGGPAMGTGGSAGSQPFAGYDPTVTFQWRETTPSVGSCKAGSYSGAFTGTYLSPIAVVIPVPISGTVTHRLEASADGEFFEIRDGTVEGTADTPIGPVPFTADFTGRLDCDNARLDGAMLKNGQYTDPNLGTVYDFEGPVEAQYDKIGHQFINGTWNVGEPTWSNPPPLYGGNGQWGSQWTGP